jgi:hypothetical protein
MAQLLTHTSGMPDTAAANVSAALPTTPVPKDVDNSTRTSFA